MFRDAVTCVCLCMSDANTYRAVSLSLQGCLHSFCANCLHDWLLSTTTAHYEGPQADTGRGADYTSPTCRAGIVARPNKASLEFNNMLRHIQKLAVDDDRVEGDGRSEEMDRVDWGTFFP